jgi:hypothetical protein
MGYDSEFSQLELFLLFKRSLVSFALYIYPCNSIVAGAWCVVCLCAWESAGGRIAIVLVRAVVFVPFESFAWIRWCSHADQSIFVECGDNEHLGGVILASRRHAC